MERNPGTGAEDPSTATAEVLSFCYEELRRLAAWQLRQERVDHTLQATAVVHEVFLQLCRQHGCRWPSHEQFLAFAARMMRRVLVDHARRRNRTKRGRGAVQVDLEGVADPCAVNFDLLSLDEALGRLEKRDPRKAAVVELRFFAGLTLDETARELAISRETVGREWRLAKAWLFHQLNPEPESP